MISLAWPSFLQALVILSYVTSLIKATGKLHTTCVSYGMGKCKSLAEGCQRLPPFLSSRTFQLLGTLKFHGPVTVEMERAVRHKVRTCKAAGELSAARKRSFQYQGPWGSGPRALWATATSVGSNCVCDL